MRTRARTGPRSSTRTVTDSGVVDEGVLPGRGVVVGVAEVAAVDQPAVAGRRRPARRSRSPGRSSTAHRARWRAPSAPSVSRHLDRMGQRRRLEGAPAVAGDLAGAGDDPPGRRLVHGDPHHGVGSRAQPGVDVLLGLRDGHAGLLLGADGDGDVDPLLGVLDPDVVDPGVVADPRALQHAEHGAHGVGVEHHRSGQPGPLGQHLHVGRRRAVGRARPARRRRSGPAATG